MANNQPPTLPSEGFIRLNQLLQFIPFGRATVYRKIKTGDFPAPVQLSENIKAWPVETVRDWIKSHGGQSCA